MLNKKQLTSIATKVRAWAEAQQQEIPYLFDKNLGQMCAFASLELFFKLQAAGGRPKFCLTGDEATNQHVFVLCGKYGVDVTASQFGKREVEVFIMDAKLQEWYWIPTVTYNGIEDFSYAVCEWDNQSPFWHPISNFSAPAKVRSSLFAD